jgi:cytosolic iron-sulfur protein assembly protein CIAO1
MIATASFDGTVVIWESQNSSNSRWELIASLEGHENEVKSVCWSQNGKWIATCGRDKSVWIWENIGQGEFECVRVLFHRIELTTQILRSQSCKDTHKM